MIKKLTKSSEELLAYFFINPNENVHIRGLEGKIDRPYSTVHNALKELGDHNLIKEDKKSKMIFYKANIDNKEFRVLKKLSNLRNLYETGLVDKLERELHPDCIILFGSYLEGRDKENSDIDIAIINGRNKIVKLDLFREKLKREIQIINIEDISKEKEEFKGTLANGFVLSGFLEVFK